MILYFGKISYNGTKQFIAKILQVTLQVTEILS